LRVYDKPGSVKIISNPQGLVIVVGIRK